MRIGISAHSGGALGMMDERLGQAPYFLVFDTRSKKWETHANLSQTSCEAGVDMAAAIQLQGLKVSCLLTGKIGAEAAKVLNNLGIKLFCVAPGIVKDILHAFLEGHFVEYSDSAFATEPIQADPANGKGMPNPDMQPAALACGGSGRRYGHGCQRRDGTC